ncbi:hypothetical protein VP01_278g1 [Puccinia sorghi]|uniref:Uncharacterized protein n=1 Tax=Puccinia sorghi TaxID=27349 RepID=A0A0L6V2N8_9BASI|nr:hypothetical protein VP01_278g1 [Puccinia sorghi]
MRKVENSVLTGLILKNIQNQARKSVGKEEKPDIELESMIMTNPQLMTFVIAIATTPRIVIVFFWITFVIVFQEKKSFKIFSNPIPKTVSIIKIAEGSLKKQNYSLSSHGPPLPASIGYCHHTSMVRNLTFGEVNCIPPWRSEACDCKNSYVLCRWGLLVLLDFLNRLLNSFFFIFCTLKVRSETVSLKTNSNFCFLKKLKNVFNCYLRYLNLNFWKILVRVLQNQTEIMNLACNILKGFLSRKGDVENGGCWNQWNVGTWGFQNQWYSGREGGGGGELWLGEQELFPKKNPLKCLHHCADYTVTVPKNLHMKTDGVWMVAWLEHATCQFKAVEQVFFPESLSGIQVAKGVFSTKIHKILLNNLNVTLKSIDEFQKWPIYLRSFFCSKAHYFYIFLHIKHFYSLINIYKSLFGITMSSAHWINLILCSITLQKKKLSQLPAVDMQKLPGSFCCYSKLSPRVIQPSFAAQSLCILHNDCAKTSTYANRCSLDDSLAGECCRQLSKLFLQCNLEENLSNYSSSMQMSNDWQLLLESANVVGCFIVVQISKAHCRSIVIADLHTQEINYKRRNFFIVLHAVDRPFLRVVMLEGGDIENPLFNCESTLNICMWVQDCTVFIEFCMEFLVILEMRRKIKEISTDSHLKSQSINKTKLLIYSSFRNGSFKSLNENKFSLELNVSKFIKQLKSDQIFYSAHHEEFAGNTFQMRFSKIHVLGSFLFQIIMSVVSWNRVNNIIPNHFKKRICWLCEKNNINLCIGNDWILSLKF